MTKSFSDDCIRAAVEDVKKKIVWSMDTCLKFKEAFLYHVLFTGKQDLFLTCMQNVLGEYCTIYWCHIFGNNKDDLHYHSLFDSDTLKLLLRTNNYEGTNFEKKEVRSRILKSVDMNDEEYRAFWNEVRNARNRFFAHKDTKNKSLFPDLKKCDTTISEYINILIKLLGILKEKWDEFEKLFYIYNGNLKKINNNDVKKKYRQSVKNNFYDLVENEDICIELGVVPAVRKAILSVP